MSETPLGIRCSVCGGTFMGYHSCGGAKPLSNLPEKWTVIDRNAERRELERLRTRVTELEAELSALRSAPQPDPETR